MLSGMVRDAGIADGEAAPTFDAVYRAHVRAVARWAARLGGPGTDIDDAVQEVFVTVARLLPGFRGDAPIEAWLFRIAQKTVANLRRRARLRRLLWLPARAGVELATTAPGPGELYERRQAEARFYRVLDALPARYRDVLVLFELDDVPTARIATLMGMKQPAVRVLLHRARAAFLRAEERLAKAERRRLPKERR